MSDVALNQTEQYKERALVVCQPSGVAESTPTESIDGSFTCGTFYLLHSGTWGGTVGMEWVLLPSLMGTCFHSLLLGTPPTSWWGEDCFDSEVLVITVPVPVPASQRSQCGPTYYLFLHLLNVL